MLTQRRIGSIFRSMSLVLEFMTVGGVRPDLESFEAWVAEISPFQVPIEQEGHRVWWYRNPLTNVYFSISYRHVDPLEEDIWAPCGLEATINHLRPSYFAREASNYLAAMVREFGMLARDADTGQLLSMDPEPEHVERLWELGNRHVREDAISQGRKPHTVTREANLRWWEYSRRRADLLAKLRTEDPAIVVPEVHFLHSRTLGRVLTAFSWKDGVGTVFPPCDLVIIERNEKHLLGFRKERKLTYVSYDALIRQIVGALKTVELDSQPYRYLTGDNSWRALERLPSIPQNEDIESYSHVDSARVTDDA